MVSRNLLGRGYCQFVRVCGQFVRGCVQLVRGKERGRGTSHLVREGVHISIWVAGPERLPYPPPPAAPPPAGCQGSASSAGSCVGDQTAQS